MSMTSRKRATPWSRSGCSTCKRRHKKCDNVRPTCSTCCRLKLECIASDNFSNVRARSTGSRKETIWARDPTLEDGSWRASSAPHLVRHFQEGTHAKAEVLGESILAVAIKPITNPANSLRESQFDITSAQQQLFQYYVERLSGLLVNATSLGNPLRTLVVPLARTSPLLFQGVCAVSSIHRSGFTGVSRSREYRHEAMEYYVRGLSSLKNSLPAAIDLSVGQGRVDTPSGEQLILYQSLLLSAIFLCKYEIIKDGITNWRKHLDGIVSFYKWLKSRHWNSLMSATMDFARSFIMYHESIACLTEPDRHTIRETEDFPRSTGNDFDDFDEPERHSSGLQTVDPYMGFSQTLILLFRRVNNLLMVDLEDDNALLVLKANLQSILDRLVVQDWTAEHFVIPHDTTTDVVRCLECISQAYEGAIYACIHSAIEEIVKRCKALNRTMTKVQAVELRAMIPVTKAEALAKSLDGVKGVPCQSPEEAGLLPVLFVIACETDDPMQVATVMQRLEVLEAHIGLGNIHSAAILLRGILNRRVYGRKWNDWRDLFFRLST